MKLMTRAARGASAYTQPDEWPTGAVDETSIPGVTSQGSDARAGAWNEILKELYRIRNLQDDWDGEGSVAPGPALVDVAIGWVSAFEAAGYDMPERVLASVNGTVYFEWHTPLGYREVEITAPAEAEMRLVRKGSDYAEVIRLTRR